ETVMLADADFIFGEGMTQALYNAIHTLTGERSDAAAVSFPVPVIWDHLRTDAFGRVTSHGRVWVHGAKPRILHRDRVTYRQVGGGGKWERHKFTDPTRCRVARIDNP